MIFVKNSRGGREVNMINTLSKIGWEGGGVNLNLDDVFKYTFFYGDFPLGKSRQKCQIFYLK